MLEIWRPIDRAPDYRGNISGFKSGIFHKDPNGLQDHYVRVRNLLFRLFALRYFALLLKIALREWIARSLKKSDHERFALIALYKRVLTVNHSLAKNRSQKTSNSLKISHCFLHVFVSFFYCFSLFYAQEWIAPIVFFCKKRREPFALGKDWIAISQIPNIGKNLNFSGKRETPQRQKQVRWGILYMTKNFTIIKNTKCWTFLM